MSPYEANDPWFTEDRAGYTPPPVARRARSHGRSFEMGRLFRTVLVIVALLWAFNYVWQNYYLTGR